MNECDVRDRAIELLGKAGIDDETVKRLEDMGYFTAPASRRHHLAVPGGLARHSVNVTKRLVEITEKFALEWPRPESPYLVGMLHDLCKCEMYRIVADAEQDGTTSARQQGVIDGTTSARQQGVIDGTTSARQQGNVEYEWRPSVYGGHGSASALMAMAKLGLRLHLTEAAAIVWHMGAFKLDKNGLWEYYRAIDEWGKFILAAHTADMIASNLDERMVE